MVVGVLVFWYFCIILVYILKNFEETAVLEIGDYTQE